MPRVRLTGTKAMRRKIDRIVKNAPTEIARALFRRAEGVMTRAKREFIPVAPDGGQLRGSGWVDEPKRTRRTFRVEFGFGGPSVPYALAVHEHPSKYSPPSWSGKSAAQIQWNVSGTGVKYLEKPLMEALRTMARDLADDIDIRRMA